MEFNINTLNKYETDGWIMSHKHKTLPLIIWNYTQATQFEGKWDDITLNCRGTVTDTDGNIIAKGFKKFFNYEEKKTNIPEDISYIEAWEKMDGSYIQLFFYKYQWIINSKGSFYSDHVNWARDIIIDKALDLDKLNKNLTYCFELIVPENRIVCDYKDEKSLYFLSAFCKGKEIEDIYPKELENTSIKFPSLLQLNKFNFESLKNENKDNKEGYVIKFSNGERCKIKFADYIRLHRILTEVSSYRVYEALRDGVDLNVWLEGVPDEFFNWIKASRGSILKDYYQLKSDIYSEYASVVFGTSLMTDKEFANYVNSCCKYPSCMFSLKNGRTDSIEKYLWRQVKPKLEYPFKK